MGVDGVAEALREALDARRLLNVGEPQPLVEVQDLDGTRLDPAVVLVTRDDRGGKSANPARRGFGEDWAGCL